MGRHLREEYLSMQLDIFAFFSWNFTVSSTLLNFWGAVKKYLCDNCNYTFDTLKENLLEALASVDVKTIRKWEHCTM